MDVITQIADSFTDKQKPFTYRITPRNAWERLLQRLKLKPQTRTFYLQNLSPGNMVRISGVAAQIKPESMVLGGPEQKRNMNHFLVSHTSKMVYVVAVGLTNTKEEPPQWLLQELEWYVESKVIQAMAQEIFARSQIELFISTIVSICGQDILKQKTSQAITGEIIAPGPSSEVLPNTSP